MIANKVAIDSSGVKVEERKSEDETFDMTEAATNSTQPK